MSGLNSDAFLKDIVQCATSTSVVCVGDKKASLGEFDSYLPPSDHIRHNCKDSPNTKGSSDHTRHNMCNQGQRWQRIQRRWTTWIRCELFLCKCPMWVVWEESFFFCTVHSILCVVFDMQCAISSVLSVVCKHGLLWALHPVCPVCHFQSGSWYLSCLQIMARSLQYFVFLKFYFCIRFLCVDWNLISDRCTLRKGFRWKSEIKSSSTKQRNLEPGVGIIGDQAHSAEDLL